MNLSRYAILKLPDRGRSSTPFTFALEAIPADANDADLALVSAVGSDVASIYRERGESVQPVYTEQRGGEFLVQFTTLLTTLGRIKRSS
jgi:hypothetical protein